MTYTVAHATRGGAASVSRLPKEEAEAFFARLAKNPAVKHLRMFPDVDYVYCSRCETYPLESGHPGVCAACRAIEETTP